MQKYQIVTYAGGSWRKERWKLAYPTGRSQWGARQAQRVTCEALLVRKYLCIVYCLGHSEGMKMPPAAQSQVSREVSASEPCARCQFWGCAHLGLCRAAVSVGLTLLSSPLLAWLIPSKYSCSPPRQWSQPTLWSFSLPHIIQGWRSAAASHRWGNMRCSWSSVCPGC